MLRGVAYKASTANFRGTYFMGFRSTLILALGLVITPAAFAGNFFDQRGGQNIPDCVNNRGNSMSVNNEQVLQWKKTTQNQFKDRGFIKGTLVGVYDSSKSHLHLDVFLGNDGTDQTGRDTDIEVIYNQEFGQVSGRLNPGVEVIACGDYITSNRATNRYPASPLGAILHWVHKRMGGEHPNGFLMIDGKMYGQMDAPPRHDFEMGFGIPTVGTCFGHACE